MLTTIFTYIIIHENSMNLGDPLLHLAIKSYTLQAGTFKASINYEECNFQSLLLLDIPLVKHSQLPKKVTSTTVPK